MTDFESKIYNALYEKCDLRKWYSIEKSRSDYDHVIESLLNINDKFGCVELNDQKDMYRRVESFKEISDMYDDIINKNTASLEGTQSIIIKEMTRYSIKVDKSLKTPKIEGFVKSIPGKDKLSPIGEKIMAEYHSKSEAKRVEEEEKKEKQRKLNEWKNQ